MLKKLFKAATVFGMLVAGYFGYCQAFVILSASLVPARHVPVLPSGPPLSRTARETTQLAASAFGPDHWTTTAPLRWYEPTRGYWMFAAHYERKPDGKRWEFWPVAVILRSKKGPALTTIAGTRAIVDFNEPFDTAKPGSEPPKVVHAKITGDVRIRDDRGTSGDIADDLTIGPLTYLEFDDQTEQIVSDSQVDLRDRTLTARGIGLQVNLMTSEGANAYTGAKTIRLLRNVDIHVQDVGQAGIVPGSMQKAKSDGTATGTWSPPPKTQPPPESLARATCTVTARCGLSCLGRTANLASVRQLPSSRPMFISRGNVRVRQGDPQLPDQLDSDQLFLTLVPNESKQQRAPKEQGTATPPESGPLSGLVLQRAEATGHAVWVQSPSQGINAQGNEVIYDRITSEQARVYFRGDQRTVVKKTNFEMRDGARVGIQSVDVIETVDITLFQDAGGAPASIVARGPGTLETRAAKDQQLERFASWNDKLVMRPIGGEENPRREITLLGQPQISSRTQGQIKARDSIIASLKPKVKTASDVEIRVDGKPATRTPQSPSPVPTSNAFEIEWMTAKGDVMLETAAPVDAAVNVNEPDTNPRDGLKNARSEDPPRPRAA